VKQGRIRDAIFQYVAAVEIDGKTAEIRDVLAQLYAESNYPDAAREQWQRAVLIQPDNRNFWESLNSLPPAAQ
jgi:Tfp pilus assembly protein PilF